MEVTRRDFLKITGVTTAVTAVGTTYQVALASPPIAAASHRGGAPAVFRHMPEGEKGLREIYNWVDGCVGKNAAIMEQRSVGRSPGGWDIPAVLITNRRIPMEEKQVAVVVLNRHGQEAGSRVVAPEIINYLTTDDAKEIRDTQLVIVIPVLNPDGTVANKFNSSRTRMTNLELATLGPLLRAHPPDVMLDYHSLGKSNGSRIDLGDMEVLIPANTTRWGMDEQVHHYIAQRMAQAAEEAGFPYELHTLEELWMYYFGERGKIGNAPWAYLPEKTFTLRTMSAFDGYDSPADDPEVEALEATAYTNYICGPAYQQWHTAVFGAEVNHWSMTNPDDIAKSGLVVCEALLKMGSARFPWEKDRGYPVNLLVGDFRSSIRAIGSTAAERRRSRVRLWHERMNFDLPMREMPNATTTVVRVRYFGKDLPMQFALCLKMRHDRIDRLSIAGKDVAFETFKDGPSTFLHIPMTVSKAGTVKLTINHPKY